MGNKEWYKKGRIRDNITGWGDFKVNWIILGYAYIKKQKREIIKLDHRKIAMGRIKSQIMIPFKRN